MITRLPRPWFLLLAFLAVGAPAAEPPQIVPLGDGTYQVTARAGHLFTRNTEKLKAAALAAATDFCAKEGKQPKILSTTEDKSLLVFGEVSSVVLTFKPLAPGDPELSPVPAAASAPPKPLTTDQLATELTKLSELRKQGLLTDEEFATLKQKLLSRF